MDITAAKQAEDELHEAHAALAHVTRVTTLGELMASIAHEVNQPLAGIVTNGEACMRWLARDVPNLDEARSAVERMIGDGRRASGIIRKLRALSRKDGLRKTPLNLNDVINDTIPLVRRELFNNRVVLRLSLAQGLPVVMGDKVQLQQVVLNLTVNAIQAMSQIGTRPRTLSVRSEPYGETGVCVTVSDSGDGIDPENTDRLFNAFFTTKDGGMGMGLSICRSIVEDHGGRIWGANNDAPGATFGFILTKDEVAK
jgi:C4-dicarboxylate-specific signal transduction histidine kinase